MNNALHSHPDMEMLASSENDFKGQSSQTEEPIISLYFPISQLVHENLFPVNPTLHVQLSILELSIGDNELGVHVEHVDAPEFEYVLAPHTLQPEYPTLFLNLPAVQATHGVPLNPASQTQSVIFTVPRKIVLNEYGHMSHASGPV